MLPVLLPLAVDGCPDLIFTVFNKKCLLVFQNAQPQAWHQGHLWRTGEGRPSDGSKTRIRASAQGVQGKLSRRLQKSGRLPGGDGAGQELEELRGGCEGLPSPGKEAGPSVYKAAAQAGAGSRGRGLCREAWPSSGARPFPGHPETKGLGRRREVRIPALCHAGVTLTTGFTLWASGLLTYQVGMEVVLAGAEHGGQLRSWETEAVRTLITHLFLAFPKSLTRTVGIFMLPHLSKPLNFMPLGDQRAVV